MEKQILEAKDNDVIFVMEQVVKQWPGLRETRVFAQNAEDLKGPC